MRKTEFVRDLPEVGEQFQLVIYRGMPALREKRRLSGERWDPTTGTFVPGKKRETTRLIGYVDHQGRFCFFYALQMSGSRKYEASRKRVTQEPVRGCAMWITTNKDRKARPTRLSELSRYHKFLKVANEFYADKILLNA